MASGLVSTREHGKKYKKDFKTLQVRTQYYDVVTAKAHELTCPRSTVVEWLIDNYLDKVVIW